MKKARQVLAIAGVILLLGMYASTLYFALSHAPGAKDMLMASIVLTIIIPVLLYAINLVARNLENSSPEDSDKK